MSLGRVLTNRTGRAAVGSGATASRLSSDLVLVHKVFRRELQLLPALVAGVAVGDLARATLLAAHCRELTTALHHHHAAESELLWPRLLDRSRLDTEVAHRLGNAHRNHAALLTELDGLLPLWESGADADLRAVLVDILTELADAVADHLDATEESVLPVIDGQFHLDRVVGAGSARGELDPAAPDGVAAGRDAGGRNARRARGPAGEGPSAGPVALPDGRPGAVRPRNAGAPRPTAPRLTSPPLTDPRLTDPRLTDPRLTDPRLTGAMTSGRR